MVYDDDKLLDELEELYDKLPRYARALVDAYDGNLRRTAALVGCSYGHARNLWMRDDLKRIIRLKQREDSGKKIIATREERQAKWTQIMYDPRSTVEQVLAASRLLGQSECDFSERKIVEDHVSGELTHRVVRGIADRVKQLKNSLKESEPEQEPEVEPEGLEFLDD